jgi:nucleotide-binding universal stress UspA family protein
MFQRIVVAHNESPECGRALMAAIRLAKSLNAELHAVTVVDELPAYTAYAGAPRCFNIASAKGRQGEVL